MTTFASDSDSSVPTMTNEEARKLLAEYQKQWNSGDIDSYLEGFTDDAVVEFADLEEIRGRDQLKRFIQSRFARQKDYRLEKTLVGVVGSTIICSWTATWTDSRLSRRMQGRGIELIQIRDGKCSAWQAAFNGWPEAGPRESMFVE